MPKVIELASFFAALSFGLPLLLSSDVRLIDVLCAFVLGVAFGGLGSRIAGFVRQKESLELAKRSLGKKKFLILPQNVDALGKMGPS